MLVVSSVSDRLVNKIVKKKRKKKKRWRSPSRKKKTYTWVSKLIFLRLKRKTNSAQYFRSFPKRS